LLSVADFANHAGFVLCGWREMSARLHLANAERLSKNCDDRVKPIIHPTKLFVVGILPKFLR